jgi:hypothetical protein
MNKERNNLTDKYNKNPLKLNDDLMNNILNNIQKDLADQLESSSTQIDKTPLSISSNKIPSKNSNNPAPKKVSDGDLLTSMAKRLSVVEKQLFDERKKVKENEIHKEQLARENINLKNELENKKCHEISDDNCKNCNILKNYIIDLTKYTEELREFLKENGFIILDPIPSIDRTNSLIKDNYACKIIGDDNYQNNAETIKSHDISDNSLSDDISVLIPKEIDIEVLFRRIEESNMLFIKDGQLSKFEMDEDKIFRLKQQKELKIFFYQNGIIIDGYNFYEFSSKEANRILSDILDGYTPSILKNNYPNGTLLLPVNNLHQIYSQDKRSNTCKFLSYNDPITNKEKISGQEFLNKFPEKVIKHGKIYNIRDDMEKLLIIKRNHEYNNDENEHFINIDKNKENELKEHICKLKIKIPSIDKIITVNVPKIEKMKSLFEFISKFMISYGNKIDIEKFCFYSIYPYKIYSINEEKSLEENGMFPNYFLIFDFKKVV